MEERIMNHDIPYKIYLTEDEMKAFGYASIARHKVPRYFIFVKDFPMNAAGKILKYKMKEETVKLLSLN